MEMEEVNEETKAGSNEISDEDVDNEARLGSDEAEDKVETVSRPSRKNLHVNVLMTSESSTSIDELNKRVSAYSAASPKYMDDMDRWLEAVDAEDEIEDTEDFIAKLEEEAKELESIRLPEDDHWESIKPTKTLQDSRLQIEKQFNSVTSLVQFHANTKDIKLGVASLSKEDAEKRFQALKEKRENDKAMIKANFLKQQEDIAIREREARNRVLSVYDNHKSNIESRKRSMLTQIESLRPKLRRDFQQRTESFQEIIEKQDAEIEERFGALSQDFQYSSRELLIDTHRRVPQEIIFNLRFARGIKDKLSRGKYTMVGYLLDEIGGVPLKYAKARSPSLCVPFWHYGKFSDLETRINRHLSVMCPSKAKGRQSNVFILELYQHANFRASKEGKYFSRIVGWTALPMMDGKGEFVQGCFRLPMLRGNYSCRFDRFFKMERKMSSDLDNWLCNLYLRIERAEVDSVPAPTATVPVDFVDELKALFPTSAVPSRKESRIQLAFKKLKLIRNNVFKRDKAKVVAKELQNEVPNEENAAKVPSEELKETKDVKNVRAQIIAPIESYQMRELSELQNERELDADTNLELYEYAVERAPKTHKESAMLHMKYLKDEILNTFSRSRWQANEIWVVFFLFLLAYWLRLYVHYFSQFLYLQNSGSATIFDFQILIHRCVLKYSSTSMPLYPQLVVIVVGTLSCQAVFVFLGLIAVVGPSITGHLPDGWYKFVGFYGILTAFDPLIALAMDLLSQKFLCGNACAVDIYARSCSCSESDVTRVFRHFSTQEGTALNAWYLTILLYFSLVLLGSALFAVYFTFANRHGRAHDLYRRLHLSEEWFFVPHDCEVSSRYVAMARTRARDWRGPQGETREPKLTDSVLSVIQMDKEKTSSKLWRQFVMQDGIILEENLDSR